MATARATSAKIHATSARHRHNEEKHRDERREMSAKNQSFTLISKLYQRDILCQKISQRKPENPCELSGKKVGKRREITGKFHLSMS